MKIFFKSKSLFQCSKYQKKSNIISNIFKISNDYYNFYTKTNNLNAEYDVYDIFKFLIFIIIKFYINVL